MPGTFSQSVLSVLGLTVLRRACLRRRRRRRMRRSPHRHLSSSSLSTSYENMVHRQVRVWVHALFARFSAPQPHHEPRSVCGLSVVISDLTFFFLGQSGNFLVSAVRFFRRFSLALSLHPFSTGPKTHQKPGHSDADFTKALISEGKKKKFALVTGRSFIYFMELTDS